MSRAVTRRPAWQRWIASSPWSRSTGIRSRRWEPACGSAARGRSGSPRRSAPAGCVHDGDGTCGLRSAPGLVRDGVGDGVGTGRRTSIAWDTTPRHRFMVGDASERSRNSQLDDRMAVRLTGEPGRRWVRAARRHRGSCSSRAAVSGRRLAVGPAGTTRRRSTPDRGRRRGSCWPRVSGRPWSSAGIMPVLVHLERIGLRAIASLTFSAPRGLGARHVQRQSEAG